MPLIVKANRDLHDPRGDVSAVNEADIQWVVTAIVHVLAQDKDEYCIAEDLRGIDRELQQHPELYCCISDRLRDERIISKAQWRAYLELRRPDERDPNITHW